MTISPVLIILALHAWGFLSDILQSYKFFKKIILAGGVGCWSGRSEEWKELDCSCIRIQNQENQEVGLHFSCYHLSHASCQVMNFCDLKYVVVLSIWMLCLQTLTSSFNLFNKNEVLVAVFWYPVVGSW